MIETTFTFVVSAFWHGLHAGNFIMLISFAIVLEVYKDGYKSWALWYKIIPFVSVRKFIAWMGMQLFLGLGAVIFWLKDFPRIKKFVLMLNCLHPGLVIVLFVLCRSFNMVGISRKIEKRSTKDKV